MANSNAREGATKQVGTAAFDPKSKAFLFSILSAFFGLITLLGVQLPNDPSKLANEFMYVLSNNGQWAAIGWAVSSLTGVAVILYQKLKNKEFNWAEIFGSINIWLLVASVLSAGALYLGIQIPVDAFGNLATAIYTGDYWGAVGILVGSILNPLIRWVQSKRLAKA